MTNVEPMMVFFRLPHCTVQKCKDKATHQILTLTCKQIRTHIWCSPPLSSLTALTTTPSWVLKITTDLHWRQFT